MKIPIVKEWGSWAVLFCSCLAGLITGLQTRPWNSGREFAAVTTLTILGLIFLINSKNPLASALRSKGKREHVLWFLFFALTGLSLLTPFLMEGIKTFSVFSLLIISYVVLLSLGKEHYLVTELNGFALLTICAPAVYFVVTGDMSFRLYFAVTIFFAAGVFKVRLRIRKTFLFRWIMILYCAVASLIFYLLSIPVLLLLPLLENITTAVLMREEKLKTTGDIELAKSIVFLIFVGLFWR